MTQAAKPFRVATLVAVLGFVLFYLFFLSAYLPLPSLVDLVAPTRQIVASSLPLVHRWTWNADASLVFRPFVAPNRVIVRTSASFIGVDAQTGLKAWEMYAGGVKLTNVYVTTEGERIVLTSFNDTVLNALDSGTGKPDWSVTMQGAPNSIGALESSDAYAYVGITRATNSLRGFSLATGANDWQPTPPGPGAVIQPLTIQRDVLYSFQDGGLYMFDKRTGRLEQERPDFLEGGTNTQVHGGTVYMWFQNSLRAKEIETERVRWTFPRPPLFYTILEDRLIVYSECCSLTALDLETGAILWEKEIGVKVVAPITLLNQVTYVMTENGAILGFSVERGDEIGILETDPKRTNPNYLHQGLATDGTCLYAAFGDKQLFAFC